MTIQQEQLTEDITLVVVDGRLDQSQNSHLETTLTQLLANGHTHLIIDLSQINYINSGGLRCLVTAWRKARQQDGNLILCGLNSRLKEIFAMVGFDKVFQIQPTTAAAQQLMADLQT